MTRSCGSDPPGARGDVVGGRCPDSRTVRRDTDLDRPAPNELPAATVAGAPHLSHRRRPAVAVVDPGEEGAAGHVAAQIFATYSVLPNYQRMLAAGGLTHPAEAAIVVRTRLR
jgi:hypothetical protein